MKALLEKIGNKSLFESFEKNDMKSFGAIASKLYRKARANQDKKEFLLAECVKFSRNENTNSVEAMSSFKDVEAQEKALNAMHEVQNKENFLRETDVLKRFSMKEDAYNNAYNNAYK